MDLTLCQGHGQCEEAAPEVFVVGDDDQVHLLMDDPPEELRSKVEEAVRRCPVRALRLDDNKLPAVQGRKPRNDNLAVDPLNDHALPSRGSLS